MWIVTVKMIQVCGDKESDSNGFWRDLTEFGGITMLSGRETSIAHAVTGS